MNTEALWVQMLRNKYGVFELIVNSINRTHCSYLWKSLSEVWEEVKNGLVWSVRDGCLVNFWNDNWLRGIGPMKRHYSSYCMMDETIRVCDTTEVSGSWNAQWLLSVLPYSLV